MFRTILYGVWFLIPVIFFLIALWAQLEKWGDKGKRENPADFFKQGLFVSACAFASVIIDQLAIEPVINAIDSEWLPLNFAQVLVFPIVLYIAAAMIGPTKSIKIEKVTHVSNRKRR